MTRQIWKALPSIEPWNTSGTPFRTWKALGRLLEAWKAFGRGRAGPIDDIQELAGVQGVASVLALGPTRQRVSLMS